jgi:hypothetical protein
MFPYFPWREFRPTSTHPQFDGNAAKKEDLFYAEYGSPSITSRLRSSFSNFLSAKKKPDWMLEPSKLPDKGRDCFSCRYPITPNSDYQNHSFMSIPLVGRDKNWIHLNPFRPWLKRETSSSHRTPGGP